jgi:hypothetical protein
MKSHKTPQTMKPATAAKKLGIHLGAAPAEFQEGVVSRDELNALQADPPTWLRDLRRNGPHPRQVTALKLGISIAGLARGGVTEPLTTQAEVRKEAARIKERDAQRSEGEPATKQAAPKQAGKRQAGKKQTSGQRARAGRARY